MEEFSKILNKIIWVLSIIAIIAVLILMMITTVNVFMRFFGGVLPGAYELIQLFTVVVAGFAMVYATKKEKHICIDIISSKLSAKGSNILNTFNSILFLMVVVLLSAGALSSTLAKVFSGEDTLMLHVPWLPFRILWVIALLVFCLVLVGKVIENISRRRLE